MKRNLIILYIGVVTCLMMSSCKDFLDLEPKSAATDENSWNTQDDANAAVAGMYSLLRGAMNTANGVAFYAYGDFPSDEITSSNTYPYNDVTNMNWNLFVASSNTSDPMYYLRRYDNFYRIVDQANRVIEKVPAMDASAFDSENYKNYLLGEAYFMRAFTYFYMGRIWGGVPILTEAVSPIYAENHEPATAEEVMQQAIQDLTLAKELLGWSNLVNNDFPVRANKGAAFALEAHVNAWIGNYEAVITAADEVINSGLYYYVSRDSIPYLTIFEGKSSEGIFEISQSAENEGTSQGIGDFTLASAKYHRTHTTPKLTISRTRIDALFTEDDKRFKYVMDTTVNTTYVVCSKYSNISYPNETTNAVGIYKHNIIVFRYSDIKLLKAEALAAIGKTTEAEELLNEVRSMSGLSSWDGSGSLIKAIFDERARELFLEGHRYFDLVRMAKYHGLYEFVATRMNRQQFDMGKHYWPFDPSMLNQNPLLRQTPFWSTVGF